MMVDHEPNSGFNLPAGCLEVPSGEPDGRTCGTCVHLIEVCRDFGVCELHCYRQPADFEDWRDLIGFIDETGVDMQSDTCARWEEYR